MGDVTREELEGDADYYLNQMKAYAIALNQQGTGRAVRVSLVFTALDDVWGVKWPIEKMKTIENEIRIDLETELPLLNDFAGCAGN